MIGRDSRLALGLKAIFLALAVVVGAGRPAWQVAPAPAPAPGPAAAPEKAEAGEPRAVAGTFGFAKAWSVAGNFSGVTTPPGGRLAYARDYSGRCSVLDATGATLRSFPFGDKTGTARVARMFDGTEGLIGFGVWSQEFSAARMGGEKLWVRPGGQGIDDVCVADLDGDGVDEVIVGFNGNTGVHAYSSRGEPLWQQASIGNVWHVAAGDVAGDEKRVVVTTSAAGKVHLFDPGDGHPLTTFDPGLYANMIRTAPAKAIPGAKGDLILVVGSGQPPKTEMVALTGAGKVRWRLDLGLPQEGCTEMVVSPDGTWAGLGCRGGSYFVVEIATGTLLAHGSEPGDITSVAWTVPAEGGPPLLVIVSKAGVAAFKVDLAAKVAP